MTNVFAVSAPGEKLAQSFRILGQPNRIRIILLLGEKEACVCHLAAHLGLRQAAISQHLMLLRDAGFVSAVRDGRNIFYRLARPEILQLVKQAAQAMGFSTDDLRESTRKPAGACPCPHCNTENREC